MYSYTTLITYVILAELFRRCCLILLTAFTGPLSKVPGPLINKLTVLPWLYQVLIGNQLNIGPPLFRKYGPVVRITPDEILVADKDSIRKILVDADLRKSKKVYEGTREYDNVATLFTETDRVKYKERKRFLSPGFGIGYLNNLEPLMHDCIELFTKVLDSKCDQEGGFAIVDMARVLANLTSDIMSATSFGGSLNLVESDDADEKGIFNRYLIRVFATSLIPFHRILPFIPPPGREINPKVDEIVSARRAEMEKGIQKKDLLQILIDANAADPIGYSDLHINQEMIIFMIAGGDTSSYTLTSTLLLLLNNPEKLKPLVAEIDAAFPSQNDTITFSKTQDLPYLNAVINESMRIRPIVVAGVARETTESMLIGGYEIPAGVLTSPWISEMQRDPSIWPDADAFIPERWLGDYKGVAADRKAFLPFSGGSRVCIGQHFALREMRLILATLIRRYELSLVPGQSHEVRVHTVPWFLQGFYNVGLKRRGV